MSEKMRIEWSIIVSKGEKRSRNMRMESCLHSAGDGSIQLLNRADSVLGPLWKQEGFSKIGGNNTSSDLHDD